MLAVLSTNPDDSNLPQVPRAAGRPQFKSTLSRKANETLRKGLQAVGTQTVTGVGKVVANPAARK